MVSNSLSGNFVSYVVVDSSTGHLFETTNRNLEALDSYQRALHHNKNSIEALRSVASILRAVDKYEEAVDYIRTILSLAPTDGESWSSLGQSARTRIGVTRPGG